MKINETVLHCTTVLHTTHSCEYAYNSTIQNIPFKWCFAIVKLVSQHNVSNVLYQRLMSYYVVRCLQALNKAAKIFVSHHHQHHKEH